MDSFLPFLISFILIVSTVAAVSHGETSKGELYWNSVLPNTPMPSAIKLLSLIDDELKTKMTSVDVSKVGVNVDTRKGHTGVNVDPKNHHKKRQRVVVTVPKYGPFLYNYAASDTQLKDDPNVALFFLEKDLHPGTELKTNFNFTYNNKGTTFFVSSKKANSIPFSSSKLAQILTRLSIEPGSMDTYLMKKTLRECEEKVKEEKQCVTSLQSMVEFSTEKLGTKKVRVVSTEVKDKEKSGKQEYRIDGVEKMKGKRMVVCHAQPYAYAVFYCHVNEKVSGYKVRMEGKDNGGVVEVVGLCHKDTEGWNKEHLAFKVLKVKPGTVPVCHFLPQDHVVWAVKEGQG
ncbi:BURP domain protein RD22-like [Dioscorea cayenensis subsp. rotundata]|uniref:BURP domain protein RD22-like n=1 Tax=Dioscorea cayennensis subsp. rotundata TaxID=55577 RepID=A0AB40CWZ4_DIOCR|nr:BURP domain protein RD22-like [Dioscorea cayenensis subsp. rotundata]